MQETSDKEQATRNKKNETGNKGTFFNEKIFIKISYKETKDKDQETRFQDTRFKKQEK